MLGYPTTDCRQELSARTLGMYESQLSEFLITGCSIPVVRTLRVRVDWVRFPAARFGMAHGVISTGCRIVVVRKAGGLVARVQFPAARHAILLNQKKF